MCSRPLSHFEFTISYIGAHVHGLAHAASGYHRVLEENRKLYNQVQDLKGNIHQLHRSLILCSSF